MGRTSNLCPDFAPELVNDLKNLPAMSQETEDAMLELMNERLKFRCSVFPKHVLIQLARITEESIRRQK